jgi:hypothetical protein
MLKGSGLSNKKDDQLLWEPVIFFILPLCQNRIGYLRW